MSVQKYIERLLYIDSLIKIKATGTIMQLAKKLGLSKRATEGLIKEMKELGCPIKYCRKRNCYYYDGDGEVSISFFNKNFPGLKKGGGGKNILVKKANRKNNAVKGFNLQVCFIKTNQKTGPDGAKFSYKPFECCNALYAAA